VSHNWPNIISPLLGDVGILVRVKTVLSRLRPLLYSNRHTKNAAPPKSRDSYVQQLFPRTVLACAVTTTRLIAAHKSALHITQPPQRGYTASRFMPHGFTIYLIWLWAKRVRAA
jgi:hypothetical protein